MLVTVTGAGVGASHDAQGRTPITESKEQNLPCRTMGCRPGFTGSPGRPLTRGWGVGVRGGVWLWRQGGCGRVGPETLSEPLLGAAGVTPPSPDNDATALNKPGKHHAPTPARIQDRPRITLSAIDTSGNSYYSHRVVTPPVPGRPRTLDPTTGHLRAMAPSTTSPPPRCKPLPPLPPPLYPH